MRMMNDTIYSSTAIGAGTTYSDTVELLFMTGYALQVQWDAVAGTGSATLTIECSNDGINWVSTGTTQAIASNTGLVMLQKTTEFYRYMRVKNVVASGTVASVTIIANAKGQ